MRRVLVVDDDPFSAQMAQAALEAAGFQALVVYEARAALERAVEDEVEAVVLDFVMPQMNGLEVLRSLRADPRTRDLPVLMLSARGESEDRVKGLREGADDYLAKPFDGVELALRIGRLLQATVVQHALSGRIESFSIAEVLQTLEQGRKSGFLVVAGGGIAGRIALARGTIRSASFGGLTGRDAVLSMLDLESGSFELEMRSITSVPASWAREALGVSDLLLEAAWLADELSARRSHLPSETAPLLLARGGGTLSPDLPHLPLTEILTALGSGRSHTLADLLEKIPAASCRVRLAVALLCEQGALEVFPVLGLPRMAQ
jgi:CheY-like chemotaxis protein